MTQDEIWIAEYIAPQDACVLARGLHFRSIHDSEREAHAFIESQGREQIGIVTRYIKATPDPKETRK